MDIPAMRITSTTTQLQLEVGFSMVRKGMEQQEIVAQGLLDMLPPLPDAAGLGMNVNVRG